MKEIKNIVLCGLGGVGCVIATSIFDANFANLKILVNKQRKERYEKEPTTFNSKPYSFDYTTPEQTDFKADLIIIATKDDGLDSAIKNIYNFIKDDTIIISVLNGIHSEAKIAKVYGSQNILYSFFIGNSCIRTGRNITQDGNYEFIIGDKNNPTSDNIKLLSSFFEKCGIKHKVSNHILERYWKKFMVNIGLNQLCTVENKTFKEVKQDPELVERIRELMMSEEAILGIHDLMIHDYGPSRVMVSLHAEVSASSDFLEMHDIIDNLERNIRQELGCFATIHMDPVLDKDEETQSLKRQVTKILVGIDEHLTLHDFRVVKGPTHTNLIFDVVKPYSLKLDIKDLDDIIMYKIKDWNPNYYCVIEYDEEFCTKK